MLIVTMRGTVSGSGALTLAVVAYCLLLWRLRRVEERHHGAPGRWWGYIRDVANLGGAALFFVAYWLGGFVGPSALVLAVALLLATYGLDWLLGKQLGWSAARWVVPLAMVALGVASVVARSVTDATVDALLAAAAPHPRI